MMVTRYATTLESSIGLNEADLVRVAQKGDIEAFNQLVRFYQDRIFSLAARILGDEDSAEDITQNTFLTAYLNLPRFRNGSFRSWIYRIATNACYDELRRHKRYPVLSLEHEDDAEERLLPLYDFQGRGILPEKEAERHELEQAIQMALSHLDVDRRAAVVLVDLQELTYQEAAQVLGIPVGTVKSRLARGRLGLSQLLGTSSGDNQTIQSGSAA